MVPLSIRCFKCGHYMMDPDHKVDGYPGVKIGVECRGRRGTLWASCLYGSYTLDSTIPLEEGAIVVLRCPSCSEALTGTRSCEQCDAPMAPLRLDTGGTVEICCRKGCKNHYLEFTDEKDLARFYDALQPYLRTAP